MGGWSWTVRPRHPSRAVAMAQEPSSSEYESAPRPTHSRGA